MRFMMLVKSTENSGPPPKELMDAIAKLGEEATKEGSMIESGGLAPAAISTRVRLVQGKITTIDGPFPETKELVGGYAVFQSRKRSKARLISWSSIANIGPAGKVKPKSARSSPSRTTLSNPAASA